MNRSDFQKMLCSCELFSPLAEQVGEHLSAIGIQSSKRIFASSIVEASFRCFDSICLQRFCPVLQSSTKCPLQEEALEKEVQSLRGEIVGAEERETTHLAQYVMVS